MFKIIACKFAGFYDVFQGDGWKTWTRVQVKRGSDHVTYIDGAKLKGLDMLRISKEIKGA